MSERLALIIRVIVLCLAVAAAALAANSPSFSLSNHPVYQGY